MKMPICEIKHVTDNDSFGLKTNFFNNLYRDEEILHLKIDESYLDDICD